MIDVGLAVVSCVNTIGAVLDEFEVRGIKSHNNWLVENRAFQHDQVRSNFCAVLHLPDFPCWVIHAWLVLSSVRVVGIFHSSSVHQVVHGVDWISSITTFILGLLRTVDNLLGRHGLDLLEYLVHWGLNGGNSGKGVARLALTLFSNVGDEHFFDSDEIYLIRWWSFCRMNLSSGIVDLCIGRHWAGQWIRSGMFFWTLLRSNLRTD